MRRALLAAMALAIAGCANNTGTERREAAPARRVARAEPKIEPVKPPPPDAGSPTSLTAMDQSNAPDDVRLTRELRKALMGDGQLSFGAKNVQIITRDGQMTLRGAVASVEERSIILRHAVTVAGPTAVDDHLDVGK